MPNNTRKWLYDQLSAKGVNLGSYEQYDKAYENADIVKWFYDTAVKSGLNMGTYEQFTNAVKPYVADDKPGQVASAEEQQAQAVEEAREAISPERQGKLRAFNSRMMGQSRFEDRPQENVAPEAEASPVEAPVAAEEKKPFEPLNMPYTGEFKRDEQNFPQVNVPEATDESNRQAQEYLDRREVERYALGRQDDHSVPLEKPSKAMVIQNAKEGKGYSIQSAIETGRKMEAIKPYLSSYKAKVEEINAKYKDFLAGLKRTDDGKVILKTAEDERKFNEYINELRPYDEAREAFEELMASPAGQEFQALVDEIEPLAELYEQSPSAELNAKIAELQSYLDRNPIYRASMGNAAPSESQIQYNLLRAKQDVLKEMEENATLGSARREIRAQERILKDEILNNSYFQEEARKKLVEWQADLDEANALMADRLKNLAPGNTAQSLMGDQEYVNAMYRADADRTSITKLQHILDKNTSDFFVNMADVFGSADFITQGIHGLSSIITTKLAADNPDMPGAKELLKAVVGKQEAEQMEGEFVNWIGRAGQQTANMIPFFLTIGMVNGWDSVAKAVGGRAEKWMLGKLSAEAAEKLGNQLAIHTLGATLGDIAAGIVSANTIGLGNTAKNVAERYFGTLVKNEDGTYEFKDGESFLAALYKGEASQSIEYWSERFGDHLQHLIGQGILRYARKHPGVQNIAESLAKMHDTDWKDIGLSRIEGKGVVSTLDKIVKHSAEVANRFGLQGYPFEAIEEEVNIIGNAIFTGDNKFSDLWDHDTQVDIWGGMLFSIGGMQAASLGLSGIAEGYNALMNNKAYKQLESTLEGISEEGSVILGAERWDSIKYDVDNASNKDLPGIIREVVASGEYTPLEVEEIRRYIATTYIYRGFNQGTTEFAKARLLGDKSLQSLDINETVTFAETEIGDAYMLGYQSSTNDENAINTALENQRERMKMMFGNPEMTREQAMAIINDPNASNEQRDAALDYSMALASAEGMADKKQAVHNAKLAISEGRLINQYGGKVYRTNDEGERVTEHAFIDADDKTSLEIYIVSNEATDSGMVPARGSDGKYYMVRRDAVYSYDESGNRVHGMTTVSDYNQLLEEKATEMEQQEEAAKQAAEDLRTLQKTMASLVGQEVFLGGNGAHEPIHIERVTKGGENVIISGPSEALKGAATAAGIAFPGGSQLEIPATALYPLLAKDGDGTISIQTKAEEKDVSPESPVAVNAEQRLAGLAGNTMTITLDGIEQEVTVTKVSDGKVHFTITDEESGRVTGRFLPVDQFLKAMGLEEVETESEAKVESEAPKAENKGRDVFVSGIEGKEFVGRDGKKHTVMFVRKNEDAEYPYLANSTDEALGRITYPMTAEEFNALGGVVPEEAAPEVKPEAAPEVKVEPAAVEPAEKESEFAVAIPVDEKTGNRIYDYPGVEDVQAWEAIEEDFGGNEEFAQKFIVTHAKQVRKALSDARDAVAAADREIAEIEQMPPKPGEYPASWNKRKADAKKAVEDKIAKTRANLPDLERRAAFWDSLSEVAQKFIEARARQAKADMEPKTLRELIAQELYGLFRSGKKINLDSVLDVVGRNQEAELTKKHNVKHVPKHLVNDEGSITVDDFVTNMLSGTSFGSLVTDEQDAINEVCDMLMSYDYAGLRDYIKNAREDEARKVDERLEEVPVDEDDLPMSMANEKQVIIEEAQQKLNELGLNDIEGRAKVYAEMFARLGDNEVVVVTMDNLYDAIVKKTGRKDWAKYTMAATADAKKRGNIVEGFSAGSVIFVVADYNLTAVQARRTQIHETKHRENKQTNAPHESLESGVSGEEMETALVNMSGGHEYDGADMDSLADEVLARASAAADEFGIENLPKFLRDNGITNEKFINFVENNIRDEHRRRTESKHGHSEGRDILPNVDSKVNGGQDGRASYARPGEVAGEGLGTDAGSEQASASGEKSGSQLVQEAIEKKRRAEQAFKSAQTKQKQPGKSHNDIGPEFSFTKNTRATIESWLNKREDLTQEERAAVLAQIEQLPNSKLQLATGRWFAKGTIRLPEDMPKVEQAVSVAEKAKVDPLQYDSPMALLDAHANFKPTEKRINPDDVPTLHKVKELPGGVVVYDVDESEESRQNMRQIINTHFGKDASPWCLLQGDLDGNLTEQSARYWRHYDAYPKQVAFKDGKLLAFSANDGEERLWWDRTDDAHGGIPVSQKMPGDELGRSATYDMNPGTGELGNPHNIHRGNDENGVYEEWYDNGKQMLRQSYKDGKRDGSQESWYENGEVCARYNCVDGKIDGIYEEYYANGQIKEHTPYEMGVLHGISESWGYNGIKTRETEYRKGAWIYNREWFESGNPRVIEQTDEQGYASGQFIDYYDAPGAIASIVEYYHGEPLYSYSFYSDGSWDTRGYYDEKGRRDGWWFKWDSKGRLVKLDEYSHGEHLTVEDWNYNIGGGECHHRKLVNNTKSGRPHLVVNEQIPVEDAEAMSELRSMGVAVNDEEVRFSWRYAPKEAEVGKIADDISKVLGVSKAKAKKWVESEMSIVATILDEENIAYLDYEADGRYTAIKKNSDYKQGTVDFNNICRKRLEFTQMYQRIQHAFPNTIITADDLAEIRNIMRSHDMMVACGLCYVEDRRSLLGEIAADFINEVKDGFKNYEKGGKQKAENAKKFRELLGDDKKEDLSIADLITLDGSTQLAKEHPGVYAAFQAFNNARGMQAGNLFQGYAEYKREILGWDKAHVKRVNDNGGLRIFSYSDFEAHHLIDVVQIIMDCARKGVKIQGYTKVPEFARAVALTGAKINRSLIPLGDTGIVDGKLAYDPVEGIDITDPNFLESNDNIGNILIGINDEQIRLAMADPFIHFIIPYHSNQTAALRNKRQVGAWTNYKLEQSEKDAKTGKKAEDGVNIYTDVLNVAEAEGKPIRTEKQFVERFLAVCKEKGLTPRFERFLEKNAKGDYVYTPGYYKFLVDFKMFDENGRILPQKPVLPIFDDEFNQKILNDYVKGVKENPGMANDEVYNEIVDALNLEERVQFSFAPETQALFDANQEIFVSNAENAVKNIKMEKATPEQWLKMIQSGGGLKAGEDKWMGLSDWLKASDAKTITKQDVLDFIGQNKIKIEEVHYAEDVEALDAIALQSYQKEFDEFVEEAKHVDTEGYSPADYAWNQMCERYGDDFASAFDVNTDPDGNGGRLEPEYDPFRDEINDAAKYFLEQRREKADERINRTRLSYTTEGLSNKREIALTVPTIEPWNEGDNVHFGDAGEGRAIAWSRFGDATMDNGNIPGAEDDYKNSRKALDDYRDMLMEKYAGSEVVYYKACTPEELQKLNELKEAERNAYKRLAELKETPERVLFIDEIQSKRHQEGREHGYIEPIEVLRQRYQEALDERVAYEKELSDKYAKKDEVWMQGMTDEELKKWQALNDAVGESEQKLESALQGGRGIPAAPFEKNWHELAMKRMLRLAAEEGYDYVAWTTGDQQAERYSLSRVINRIETVQNHDGSGLREVYLEQYMTPDPALGIDGTSTIETRLDVGENGQIVDANSRGRQFIGRSLADVIGKDLAVKTMTTETDEIGNAEVVAEGEDLKIGGEGMKGFYDDMLVRFVNKYAKKWGVQVKDDLVNLSDGAKLEAHVLPITDEMRDSVMEGQVMFSFAGDERQDNIGTIPTNRTKPAPKKMLPGYKLFNVDKFGRPHTLFIDANMPLGEGVLYDAVSPALEELEKLDEGNYYVTKDGEYKKIERAPGVEDVNKAAMDGGRYMKVGHYADGSKSYYNYGLNGTGDVATFALRPGWHLTTAPTMHQLGAADESVSGNKSKPVWRRPNQRWFKIEYSADVDYGAEGKLRKGTNDMQTMPTDGFYYKATNGQANTNKQQWIIAGTIRIVKPLNESEVKALNEKLGTPQDLPYKDGVKDFEEVEREKKLVEIEREGINKTLDTMASELGVAINRVGRDQMRKGHKRDKGYYNPKTGEVTICMDNVNSERDAIATVLHETVAHLGLRKLLGDRFNDAMVRIYSSLDSKGKKWVNAYIKKHGLSFGDPGIIRGVEEYMAHLAESGNFINSAWDDIKAIIGKIVDALFGTNGFLLTDNELNYILRASYEHLKNPNWMDTVEGRAFDTLLRAQLGINENNPDDPTDPEGLIYRDSDAAAVDFEKDMQDWRNVARMEHQDADHPVRLGMKRIMKEKGIKSISEDADYLMRSNLASSRSETQGFEFMLKRFTPMLKMVDRVMGALVGKKASKIKRNKAYNNLLDYLYAESGLERNAYKNNAIEAKKQEALEAARAEADEARKRQLAEHDEPELEKKLLKAIDDNLAAQEEEITNRFDAMKRDWSGITDLMGRPKEEWQEAEADARDMVADFRARVGDGLVEDLWNYIRDCTDFNLEHAHQYGLLTREEYERLHGTESQPRMWQYYLPLRGFDAETAEDVYEYNYATITSGGGVVMKAKGRWKKAGNPLANIANIALREIVQGNDNWAKQALLQFTYDMGENSLLSVREQWYVKNETTGDWEPAEPDEATNESIGAFEKRMRELKKGNRPDGTKSDKPLAKIGRRGLALDKIMANKGNRNSHMIRVKVNGIEYGIWVNSNPILAKAVNKASKPNLQTWRKWSRAVSNLFTTYSLNFSIRNLIRDTRYSRRVLKVKEDKVYRHRYNLNWLANSGGAVGLAIPMVNLMYKWENGILLKKEEDGTLTEREQMFVDFMRDGGQTGYTIIKSVEKIKNEIDQALRLASGGVGKINIPVVHQVAEFIKTLNEGFELLTRFTAYQTSRDMGRSGERAASDAKEISVNFNRRGMQSGEGFWGKTAAYLGATHYFYNASVQGFQNFAHLFSINKVSMTAKMADFAIIGMVIPMLNAALAGLAGGFGGDGDDDDASWYWDLPEYVRRNFIVIGSKQGYISIPLPPEFRAFYGLGDIVASLMYGKNPTQNGFDIGFDMITTMAGVLPLNPVEGYSSSNEKWYDPVVRAVTPDIMMFVVDAMTNRDYTGRPLYKENPFSHTTPLSQGAYASTPKFLVDACQWVAEKTSDKKLYLDWAPGIIRDAMKNYGGGPYKLIEDVLKLTYTDEDRPRRWDNIPFFSGFTGHLDEDRSNSFEAQALHDYKKNMEEMVSRLSSAAGDHVTPAVAFGDFENIPKGAKTEAILNSKEYILAREYYKGMQAQPSGTWHYEWNKKGKKHPVPDKERDSIENLEKKWRDMRSILFGMPEGTEEEKAAKSKYSLEVQQAWHEYYSAQGDLLDKLMDIEYSMSKRERSKWPEDVYNATRGVGEKAREAIKSIGN